MTKIAVKNLPDGFSEYFSKKLAECVAKGIVEKSIRVVHEKNKMEESEDENADYSATA